MRSSKGWPSGAVSAARVAPGGRAALRSTGSHWRLNAQVASEIRPGTVRGHETGHPHADSCLLSQCFSIATSSDSLSFVFISRFFSTFSTFLTFHVFHASRSTFHYSQQLARGVQNLGIAQSKKQINSSADVTNASTLNQLPHRMVTKFLH